MTAPAAIADPGIAGGGAAEVPTDARLLSLAAKPGVRLFRVLEDPRPLRPLLAAVSVLPAVLAGPRCRIDTVDPGWGLACLAAAAGDADPPTGPGGLPAFLTGLALRDGRADAAVAYFGLSWAGATLLVWATWQLAAAAWTPRMAAFAALLIATNPVTVAAAAGPPHVLGAAFAVAAAWLWVRLLRDPGGRPVAAAGPLGVVAWSLPTALFGRRGGRAAAVAGFAAGLAAVGGAAAATGFGAEGFGRGLPAPALAGVGGLAALGLTACLAARRWAPAKVRVAAGGWATAAVLCGVLAWSRGGPPRPAEALAGLVAAVLLASLALEGACKPAVPVRLATLLTVLPAAVLAGFWAWDADPLRAAWRAVFLAVAAAAVWGVWQVAAFRSAAAARERRLLIGAVLAVALGGAAIGARRVPVDAGAGERRLVEALARRPERDVTVLVERDARAAAAFLFAAAAPDRPVAVFSPDDPGLAERLTEAFAEGRVPLVAVVGGGPGVWLDGVFAGRTVPLVPAGSVGLREVRVAVFDDGEG